MRKTPQWMQDHLVAPSGWRAFVATARALWTAVPARMRRLLVWFGAATSGLLALWLTARGIAPQALGHAFRGVDWRWAVGAGVLNAAGAVAESAAWRMGLAAGGMGRVPLRHVLAATWIGRAGNEVLPGRAGEVGRVLAVRRHVHEQRELSRIAGSLVAHRVLAGLAAFFVITIAAVSLPLPGPFGQLRWAALAALVLAPVVLWAARTVRAGHLVARLIPRKLRGIARTFAGGAALLGTGRTAALALGLHLAALATQLGTVILLLQAFAVPAPITAGVMVLALGAAAAAIPAAPGGLGLSQAAIVAPLVATYGVTSNLALAFALGLQATVMSVAVICGLAALVHQRFARPAARVFARVG